MLVLYNTQGTARLQEPFQLRPHGGLTLMVTILQSAGLWQGAWNLHRREHAVVADFPLPPLAELQAPTLVIASQLQRQKALKALLAGGPICAKPNLRLIVNDVHRSWRWMWPWR